MSKRDPFTAPFCEPEDLGLPIPESEHAVSVCLPRWKDVIGYEEGDEETLDALECGYPRFVEHPLVAELFVAAQQEFAKRDEVSLVFPSLSAAWRCAEFAKANGASSARLESYGWNNLTVLLVREEDYGIAWKGWQHMGEIVSSRLAEAALTDAPLPPEMEETGATAAQKIRERIAEPYQGVGAHDVFLFSSGMAAIAATHRVALKLSEGLPTIQLEFPYIDALKLQEKCNAAGVVDYSMIKGSCFKMVSDYFGAGNKAAALFSEVPSNPLLRTANLPEISPVLRERGVPLILDDTVATSINVDAMRFADAVTTSLTKGFSGAGDVAAGAVILNPESPFYDQFREELSLDDGSPLFCLDALALEVNSRHFPERTRAMTENTEEIVSYLSRHPRIETIWYPSMVQRENYDALKREDGGYGSLFSMKIKGGVSESAKFYDQLAVSKGPSLGTNFSLACPYTLLAHYNELEWAESCGVPRELIRVSIGLEETDDLLERFEEALD